MQKHGDKGISGDLVVEDWRKEAINGGSLRLVDIRTGSNGWASPPGDLFHLRGKNYFSRKERCPAGDYLLDPAGVDWLRASGRLDHVLARSDNRIMTSLRRAQSAGRSQKTFVLAINLQIPGRDHHSAVFYYAREDPIPLNSLLYRFVHENDAFRNARFKIVNRVVKGPWIVRAAVGNYAACLLGRALTCTYYRGNNYLEIDVDIASSAIAKAILHLAVGRVTSITIDMGFVVEGVVEEELPERLLGAVRLAQMKMESATLVDVTMTEKAAVPEGFSGGRVSFHRGLAKVNHHNSNVEDSGTGKESGERCQ